MAKPTQYPLPIYFGEPDQPETVLTSDHSKRLLNMLKEAMEESLENYLFDIPREFNDPEVTYFSFHPEPSIDIPIEMTFNEDANHGVRDFMDEWEKAIKESTTFTTADMSDLVSGGEGDIIDHDPNEFDRNPLRLIGGKK